jgi:hypothetical protein
VGRVFIHALLNVVINWTRTFFRAVLQTFPEFAPSAVKREKFLRRELDESWTLSSCFFQTMMQRMAI